jgi:hypothetical protein
MHEADYFRRQALKCRMLAASTSDKATVRTLLSMAHEAESEAARLIETTPKPRATGP